MNPGLIPGVLVTRPVKQARATAERLSAVGYRPFIAPMLTINFTISPEPLDLQAVQAVLITSLNGAEALSRATSDRKTPVLAVGDKTAHALREYGFRAVRSAAGDATALAALAAETLEPDAGAVLHVRGRDGAHSPLAGLQGFNTREALLYEAVQSPRLPTETQQALLAGDIRAALVYSTRSGAALAEALRGAECGALHLVGLSKQAVAPLAEHGFAGVSVAEAPDENALFMALRSAVPTE